MFSTIPSRIAKAFPGATGGGGFSPADISDLVGWWDAEQGVSLSGSNVVTWADQSSTMGSFSVRSGASAIYYSNGFGVNSQPYIAGQNGSDYITANNWPTTTASTFYAVFSKIQDLGGLYQRYMEGAGYGSGFTWLDADGGAADEMTAGFTTDLNPKFDIEVGDTGILRVKWNGSSNLIKLNNNPQVATSNALASQPSSPLVLFNQASGGFGVNFNVAEIIIYNKVLNDTELAQVDNYLSTKYGITL